jgi:hypothetical protein
LIARGFQEIFEESRNEKENPRKRKKGNQGKAGYSPVRLSRMLRMDGIAIAICLRQINSHRKIVFSSPKKANHSKGWDAKSPA